MTVQSNGSSPVKVDGTQMQNKGGVHVDTTKDDIEVVVDDVEVKKVRDQKQQMIQAIGCYNNPGGPTC